MSDLPYAKKPSCTTGVKSRPDLKLAQSDGELTLREGGRQNQQKVAGDSLNKIDKIAVAKAFSKCASRYNKTAQIQHKISASLLALLEKHIADLSASAIDVQEKSAGLVLDLGSGSGFYLQALRNTLKPAHLLALDLSQGMLAAIPKSSNALPLAADYDALPLANNSVDIIFSSMSMQWSNDPAKLVGELCGVAKPHAMLAFSTLLEGSLPEIDVTWHKVDGRRHGLSHPPLTYWQEVLDQTMQTIGLMEKKEVQRFATIEQLLESIRAIGASDHRQAREKNFIGRQRYREFLDALAETSWDSTAKSYQLSYRVLYAVAQNAK